MAGCISCKARLGLDATNVDARSWMMLRIQIVAQSESFRHSHSRFSSRRFSAALGDCCTVRLPAEYLRRLHTNPCCSPSCHLDSSKYVALTAMTDDKVNTRPQVLAWGSNLFAQLPTCPHDYDGDTRPRRTLDAAACIIATCSYQTVFRSPSGELRAHGESPHLIEHVCQCLLQDRPKTDTLVFVGKDIFEAVLDVEGGKACFLDYAEESEREQAFCTIEGSRWKTAAVDGRGRCMAVDLEAHVYLFGSVADLKAATQTDEAGVKLRQEARFQAHVYSNDGIVSPVQATSVAKLPRFDKVSAGNAHFVLLSRSNKEAHLSPIWIFGDARFGAVPIKPFDHTIVVGLLVATSEAASTSPTDIAYLMPVTHFSTHEGFPSGIADACAGSRHTLVLTCDGDLYGWGWNEDSALLPFGSDENGIWENNIVYEPTLVPLPRSGNDSDVSIVSINASNGRSFGITTQGQLLVAGSNEFGCLGLNETLSGLKKKPRFERDFSQIKKEYDCVNGWQMHPDWKFEGDERVVDVHATMLATLITVETTC